MELCSEKIVPRPGRYHTSCRSIFVIFCMVLGNNNRRKITEPDFWKKIQRSRNLGKSAIFHSFSNFTENLDIDLVSERCLNQRYDRTWHFGENRMFRKNLVLSKLAKVPKLVDFLKSIYLPNGRSKSKSHLIFKKT